ncbi:PIG-L deacetylase family protein [Frankia sp. CcWB2]
MPYGRTMQEERVADERRPFADDSGTPESVWQGWDPGWAELDLTVPPTNAVIVAPHPDDEVLGIGGLMTILSTLSVSLTVVAVTDGDASHPGSPTLSPAELARRRVAEQHSALAELGLAQVPVHRVGLRDGRVAGHEELLADQLEPLLTADGWLLATYAGDRHPDHEATGRAAEIAAARTGTRLLEYPVWTWHWAVPDDPRVPWARARRVHLPVDVQRAKQRAVDCYRTQIAPLSAHPADAAVLPAEALARLLRPAETVFV